MWEHLEHLNSQGVTIFLTTQHMDEADRLCRRLAIIDHGRLVAEGSPTELKAGVGGDIVHVDYGSLEASRTTAWRWPWRPCATLPEVRQADTAAGGLTATVSDGGATAPAIMRALQNARLVDSQSVHHPTLAGRRVPPAHRAADS